MKISDKISVGPAGRLASAGQNVPLHLSPNVGGPLVSPRFLIMHYTAGRSLPGAVQSFCDPQRKASAHVIIDRDGTIAQCASLDQVAWHAGLSRWKDPLSGKSYEAFNKISIGVELVNAGLLRKVGRKYVAWWGGAISSSQVYVDPQTGRAWHAYTEDQIQIALDVAQALFARYDSLREILGHEDIAPGRKIDPGPAFPMRSFRSVILGRGDEGGTE